MNDCFQPTRLRRARPSIGNTVWGNPIVEWHRIALVLLARKCRRLSVSFVALQMRQTSFSPSASPISSSVRIKGRGSTPNNFRKDLTLCRYNRRL
jgi:hypothetical protein